MKKLCFVFTHLFLVAATCAAGTYRSLTGEPLEKGNVIGEDGRIRAVTTPVLRVFLTAEPEVKGRVLLLPGGGYNILSAIKEGAETAKFLASNAYDVAILEYPVAAGPTTRDLALKTAKSAYQSLRTDPARFGLRGQRLGIMGYSAGAHLAARTVQFLPADEQPDDVILIYPAYLHETVHGTVNPSVVPPKEGLGRLFTLIAANDRKPWVESAEMYTKTWRGFGGEAAFHLLPQGGHGFGINTPEALATDFPKLFSEFLRVEPPAPRKGHPADQPAQGRNAARHQQKCELAARQKFDLIMVGDSITHNLDNPNFSEVWNHFFAPRNALNLGFSGYRTENILWNLQHGQLAGQSPKVITLMIGTNNVDEKNYPVRHTAPELARGVAAIVQVLRTACPTSKILLLRTFNGSYDGEKPTSHRLILDRASDIFRNLADDTHVFYGDVNHVFLLPDGRINRELMPDFLHPNPEGALRWAQAMEPLLSRLMGDESRDPALPTNSAIIPTPKLEKDSYDWHTRHAQVLEIKDRINPEIVLIGDSITHFWAGEPAAHIARGKAAWDSVFAGHRVLNLGFGWDRTQNVLWRLDHGHLDGLDPRMIVLHIGTNNTSETRNARKNTPQEIGEAVLAICTRIRSKTPRARIVLMAVFPREKSPEHPRRLLIQEINNELAMLAKTHALTFVDIASVMLQYDGTLPPDMAADACHPTEKGYQVWANALHPLLPAAW
jgi:lysophospholipase L1-like esterase/acetyl esterase/lipase